MTLLNIGIFAASAGAGEDTLLITIMVLFALFWITLCRIERRRRQK